MSGWLKYIYSDIWAELGDPEAESAYRSTDCWFHSTVITRHATNQYTPTPSEYFWLRGGPWLTWLASAAYLYIVLKAGPRFMQDRKPYDPRLAIRVYNLILVIINAYLFYGSVSSFRWGLDFWGCSEALHTRKREYLLHYGHLFFHTRYLEFFDTFFFVLRKKTSQVTFLHVFHHGIVPTLMYVGLKFYPVPFNALLPTTNMFVHTIMYAYYGLATFGPGMQKYLWWKRYLTTMQISQFALLLVHCAQPIILANKPGCSFPPGLIIINSCIGLTFLLLFLSFYKRTYILNKQIQARKLRDKQDKGRVNGSCLQEIETIEETRRGEEHSNKKLV